MVEITVTITPYNGLSLEDVVITLTILSITKVLEFLFLRFKRHYEPASQKKIQNVIITNAPMFWKLAQNIDEIKRNTLYYVGKKPTKKDELLNLTIFFGFSIISIYGLPYLEAFIINNRLEQYLAQNDNITLTDYWMFIFNNVINVFLLISFVAIMLMFHRRDIIASIFYNRPYLVSHTFSITPTERQFRRLRIYSYLLLLANILGVIQLIVIFSVGETLIKIVSANNEISVDLFGNIILLGFLILFWIVSFITTNRMISHRILINHLTTLLEAKKLPYARLSLFSGDSVEGLIFNPFTDKTYLVMVDLEGTTKLFIPWKRIEWLKLGT